MLKFNLTPTDDELSACFTSYDHNSNAGKSDPLLTIIHQGLISPMHRWVTLEDDGLPIFPFIMDTEPFFNPKSAGKTLFNLEESAFLTFHLYYRLFPAYNGKDSLYHTELSEFLYSRGIGDLMDGIYEKLKARYYSESL